MDDETIPIRREDEGDVQRLRILQPLLDPVVHAVVAVLGLIERERNVLLVVMDVIDALGLASRDQLPPDEDAASGEADLLTDLRHLIPPGILNCRRDEFGTNVVFGDEILVNASRGSCSPSPLSARRRKSRWLLHKGGGNTGFNTRFTIRKKPDR